MELTYIPTEQQKQFQEYIIDLHTYQKTEQLQAYKINLHFY